MLENLAVGFQNICNLSTLLIMLAAWPWASSSAPCRPERGHGRGALPAHQLWTAAIQGIALLVALYIGGVSGGLISAILLRIPGTPSSVPPPFDGGPLAAKGEAGKALGVGIFFSFMGTLFSVIALVFISPFLATSP
jgi:hypothetical protein